ncbi:MAG: sxtJ [Acidobacteria bacterium]|nr:MAG: sxtJ [Acidobacteriota bacterium]
MSTKSNQQLRRFGLIVGLGLSIIGTVSWYRGHSTAPLVMWSIAVGLVLLGLVYPPALRPVEKGWIRFGNVLGWINTRIILTLLFALVVTPIGAIARLFRDPLNRRLDPNAQSYWISRTPGPVRPETYERQF